ncbi:uncharacterized protein LACBIDRAFT_306217 [Laccaria bicolor S238N-H82]|uniref:Predicted protein n=1 Tax=Laccaria bicolor (strain S238N-H82 / ATCC MYA-4686) TaxID=486041 RepID=B0CT68_LACBS|nr:uncharacterized protein LACBIDRAFT_306217 [Laccaria bicolor S238N-H82]EDR14931.1 predicted protein [Laccaria bicolor S238N-H82]|eukprot:XP_001875490.1 predicted protein [Laccaria bicolor S238N-H82]
MDLLQIGAHCSLPSCNDLDFLPIVCNCNKHFCRFHSAPDRHSCPLIVPNDLKPPLSTDRLQRCIVESCNKPSLSQTCLQCLQAFCPDHRYPDSHTCSPHVQPVIEPLRSENARAIFAKHFPQPSGTSKRQTLRTKISTNPAKLAQLHKVELIKLRRRALPGDPRDKSVSVPSDQRLHIKVAHTDKVFWFRKTLIAGKVLDLIATQLHFSFSDSTPIDLCKLVDDEQGHVVLRKDQLLAEQVEDPCTLLIRPGCAHTNMS